MTHPTTQPCILSEFSRALEIAAVIADTYAQENLQLGCDTVLLDPLYRADAPSLAGVRMSNTARHNMHIYAAQARAALNIAGAIRAAAVMAGEMGA